MKSSFNPESREFQTEKLKKFTFWPLSKEMWFWTNPPNLIWINKDGESEHVFLSNKNANS